MGGRHAPLYTESPFCGIPSSYLPMGMVGVGAEWDVRVTSKLEITRSLPSSDIVGNSFTVSRTMFSALRGESSPPTHTRARAQQAQGRMRTHQLC